MEHAIYKEACNAAGAEAEGFVADPFAPPGVGKIEDWIKVTDVQLEELGVSASVRRTMQTLGSIGDITLVAQRFIRKLPHIEQYQGYLTKDTPFTNPEQAKTEVIEAAGELQRLARQLVVWRDLPLDTKQILCALAEILRKL